MIDRGKLILVVGPSGAGKDTLIDAARIHLADDPQFVFPRRLVTRDATPDVEDHDTISRAQFDVMQANEQVALAWEAHGHGYIIPQDIEVPLEENRTVVCNTSRRVINTAAQKYPGAHVLFITAHASLRAKRLAGRGRETEDEIVARLKREAIEIPPDVPITTIDNSRAVANGVAATVAALVSIAKHQKASEPTA